MKQEKLNNYACLVAGGAGFIGSYLCDRLLDQGYEVYCVDNLLTGSRDNISNLQANPQFHFIKQDITRAMKFNFSVQFIYHLASPASPVWYQRYPLETLLVNTYGTYLLLQEAKRMQAKFLFASTSEIYGDPKEHPQKESYSGNVNTVGPRSCYDESKRCGESFVYSFIHTYGLDARIVRIFNTYGPRMQPDDGRVISNFIHQILQGKPLTIYGTGDQTRSFCFVTDMVEGIILAMNKQGTKGQVINLGNDKEMSVNEIARSIAKTMEKPFQVKHRPLPESDPARRRPDITLAKKILDWVPRTTFEEGIKKTVSYIQKDL